MKKVLLPALVLAICFASLAFMYPTPQEETADLKWYTWEEALKLNEENPKKIMIDMYTSWCGWCKVMDKKTFSDPKVSAYLNENFYAVKFNAEQKEEIEYKGHTFKFLSQGRRGVHQLAYSLLDGKLSYPSIVYLDEEQRRITISPGFKEAPDMLKELTFVSEEHYKTTSFNEYKQGK